MTYNPSEEAPLRSRAWGDMRPDVKKFYDDGETPSRIKKPLAGRAAMPGIQRREAEEGLSHGTHLDKSVQTLTPALRDEMRSILHPEPLEQLRTPEELVRDGAPALQATVVVEQLPLFPVES